MIVYTKSSARHRFLSKEWITEHGIDATILFVALGLGSFLRIIYLVKTNFPLNDGGLFYRMVQDLQANHYLLPLYTTYNNASLPFVYPPLSFYLIGLANQFLGINLIDIFRYFPLFVNLLTIPVFFSIARKLLNSSSQVYLATMAFAWLKPAYEWLIMGGGVTRSPGFLFGLIAIDQGAAFLLQDKRKNLILAAITFSLAILFHFEMAWFAMISLIILIIFIHKWRKGIILLASIVIGVVIIGFPYWYQIILHNDFEVISYGFASGDFNILLSSVKFFFFNYTEEGILPLFAVIAIFGLAATLATKNFMYLAWLIALTFLDYRSANRINMLPVCLLIGIGLDVVILPSVDYAIKSGLACIGNHHEISDKTSPAKANWFKAVLLFGLFFQLLLVSYLNQYTDQALNKVISPADRAAMNWMENNIKPGARVLIIPSSASWELDPVSEWFPALTHLVSIITVQGFEWTKDYYQRISAYETLGECVDENGADCLENYLDRNNESIDYVYFSRSFFDKNVISESIMRFLAKFPVVYSDQIVTIYQYDY
jgi:hypothetical protein